MNIQPLIPYLIVAAVLIAAGLIIGFIVSRIRSQKLKQKFGPEYDFALDSIGDRHATEEDLKQREARIVNLDIHPLNDAERDRYHHEWIEIQSAFVDDPTKSVERANLLITEVMISRGFPVADFEQRTSDLSVMMPNFVPNYREANSIAMKNRQGAASTEDLRQAMIDYRSLFNALLGTIHIEEKELEAV